MSRYYSSVKHRKWQRHYHLYTEEVDPVVEAATANLNSPVVFNFVSKASLADSLIHGTASPSMALGSFASGASGFPFNYDACIDTGLTPTQSAGEFLAVYVTDYENVTNAYPVLMGTQIAGGINIRGLGASTRFHYGGAGYTTAQTVDGTYINSAGDLYINNSNLSTLSFTSDVSVNLYIGGFSSVTARACKCNMVYAVYAPSIATTASAAASAIHSAMVSGAP